MKLSVTFRQMEPSEAIKQHVEDKLTRIEKYFHEPARAQAVLSQDRYRHGIDITLTLANGTTIKGSEVAEDMYTAIDLVMDKIDRQVRRYKDKITTHRTGDRVEGG